MKNIKVFSRQDLKNYLKYVKIDSPTIIISITDTGSKFPNFLFKNYKNLEDVIFLKFDDVGQETEGYTCMNEQDADRIIEFVTKHSNIENIFVHCYAGISRSAGVAAALSKIFNNDDMEYFNQTSIYVPNMLCYNLVMNSWYNKVKNE